MHAHQAKGDSQIAGFVNEFFVNCSWLTFFKSNSGWVLCFANCHVGNLHPHWRMQLMESADSKQQKVEVIWQTIIKKMISLNFQCSEQAALTFTHKKQEENKFWRRPTSECGLCCNSRCHQWQNPIRLQWQHLCKMSDNSQKHVPFWCNVMLTFFPCCCCDPCLFFCNSARQHMHVCVVANLWFAVRQSASQWHKVLTGSILF